MNIWLSDRFTWILILAFATAGGGWIPLHVSPSDIARVSCPGGGVCPFDCGSTAAIESIDDQTLMRFLSTVESLPTFSMWGQRDLIYHWEVLRQQFWEPTLRRSEESLPLQADVQRVSDASTVVHALYYRTLTPPSFARAWDSGDIAWPSVRDARVASILHELRASEALQVSLGQVLIQPAGHEIESVNIRDELVSALGHNDDNFFACIAAVIYHSTSDREALLACLLCGHHGCKAVAVEEAQAFLDQSIDAMSVTATAAKRVGLPLILTSSELATLDAPATTRYAIYINTWVDLECQRISQRLVKPQPEVLQACDAILAVIAGQRDHRLANMADLKFPYTCADVPEPVRISLEITSLEYLALMAKTGPAPSVTDRLDRVFRLLLSSPGPWPDWYDTLNFMEYLRSRSPYVSDMWSQGHFDGRVAEMGD